MGVEGRNVQNIQVILVYLKLKTSFFLMEILGIPVWMFK